MGGAGEKVHFGLTLKKEIEIVRGNLRIVIGNGESTDNVEDFLDGCEVENEEIVRVNLSPFFHKPTKSGGGGREVRLPVGIGEFPGAAFESFLDGNRRSDITLELSVGDVDILKRKIKVWIVGDELGVGASKTAVGAHFGVVSEKNEVGCRFVDTQKVVGEGKVGFNKASKGEKEDYIEAENDG